MSVDVKSVSRCSQGPGRRMFVGGGALALFLAVVHTASDAVHTMLSTLLPTIQARFDLTETGLALLVGTLWVSSSFAQPIFGALGGRVNRRLVAASGVVMNAALLSLVGVLPAVWLLFGAVLLGGMGSAALHPIGANVARSAGGERKGLAVGLFSGGGELGFAIGPVAVLFVASEFGLGATPWLMVPGVLLGLLVYRVVPEEEASPNDAHPKLLDLSLFRGPLGGLAVTGVLAALPFITYMSATPLWLVDDHGYEKDAPAIALALSGFALGAALGAVLAGALSTRLSPRSLIVGSMLAAPIRSSECSR